MHERVSRLRALGFSGILITTRALPDAGAGLIEDLSLLGHRESTRSTDGHFVFVRLAAGS